MGERRADTAGNPQPEIGNQEGERFSRARRRKAGEGIEALPAPIPSRRFFTAC